MEGRNTKKVVIKKIFKCKGSENDPLAVNNVNVFLSQQICDYGQVERVWAEQDEGWGEQEGQIFSRGSHWLELLRPHHRQIQQQGRRPVQGQDPGRVPGRQLERGDLKRQEPQELLRSAQRGRGRFFKGWGRDES